MTKDKDIFDYIDFLWIENFTKKTYKKWDVIFSYEDDTNFYIVSSWIIGIFKNTWDTKKEVARVERWWLLWEWVVYWKIFKDAEAIAEIDSEILSISAEKIKEIENTNPQKIIEFYKQIIIKASNIRLANTWAELATIYKLTDILSSESFVGRQKFIKLLNFIKETIWVDYVTYVENHPYLDEIFYYKLSTLREFDINEKCENEIFKDLAWFIKGWTIMLTESSDNLYILPLKTSLKLKWFLIFGNKNKSFSESLERILKNISLSFCSIIEQNQENNWKEIKE